MLRTASATTPIESTTQRQRGRGAVQPGPGQHALHRLVADEADPADAARSRTPCRSSTSPTSCQASTKPIAVVATNDSTTLRADRRSRRTRKKRTNTAGRELGGRGDADEQTPGPPRAWQQAVERDQQHQQDVHLPEAEVGLHRLDEQRHGHHHGERPAQLASGHAERSQEHAPARPTSTTMLRSVSPAVATANGTNVSGARKTGGDRWVRERQGEPDPGGSHGAVEVTAVAPDRARRSGRRRGRSGSGRASEWPSSLQQHLVRDRHQVDHGSSVSPAAHFSGVRGPRRDQRRASGRSAGR